MQEVGRRELELDRRRLVDDPDQLAVRGIVGRKCQRIDDATIGREVAGQLDGWGPRVVGPDVQSVDRGRIAGERPDERQLVDDAAEQDLGVEAPERALPPPRPAPRGAADPSGRSSAARTPDGMSSGGGSRRACASCASDVGMEDGDLDRAGRAVPALIRDPSRVHDRRVVQLHVAELQPGARRSGQPSLDRIDLREGERERLLGEDRPGPASSARSTAGACEPEVRIATASSPAAPTSASTVPKRRSGGTW